MFSESQSFNLFFWGVCEKKWLKTDFVYFEEQKNKKTPYVLRVIGRVERGSFTLTLSQNRA